MGVSSFYEFITTLLGWIVFSNITDIIIETGLLSLAFIIILVKHWGSSVAGGDDEGSASKQSLKKTAVSTAGALFVIIFGFIPAFDVQLSDMNYAKFDAECNEEVINGTNTGTTYDEQLASMGGQVGKIPALWLLTHQISKGITSAAIASLPCTGDLRAVELDFASVKLKDNRVNMALQDFIEDCFMPATARHMGSENQLSEDDLRSTYYMGSQYFLQTYYREADMYSKKPRPGWAFDPSRDVGFESDAPNGHPTCAQWWSDPQGLREALLINIDINMLDEYVYENLSLILQITGIGNQTEREDIFLNRFLQAKESQTALLAAGENLSLSFTRPFDSDSSNAQILTAAASTAMAGLGGIIKTPGHLAMSHAVREGSTIFLSLVLLLVVMLMPFILLMSVFSLSALLSLLFTFFALHQVFFIFNVAYWLDNYMIEALTSGSTYGIFTAALSPTQLAISTMVQGLLYLALPLLWLSMLGWVGIKTIGALGAFTAMGDKTSNIAATGGDLAVTAATKGKA